MAANRIEQRINPASMTTRLIEQAVPAKMGLARRRLVSIDQMGGETFVQVGSTLQISFIVDLYEDQPDRFPISAKELFHLQQLETTDNHLLEDIIEEKSVAQLKAQGKIEEGLVEDVYVYNSKPDSPSIPVPEERGVWAPVDAAFGGEWKFV